MGSTIPMLGCFSFLVVMTVSPALCEHDLYNRSAPSTVIPLNNNTRGSRSVQDTGYLVGDTTPVWVIRHPGPDSAWQYIKQRDGFIQEAIDEWRPFKPESSYSNIVQTKETEWEGRSDDDNPEDFDVFVKSAKRNLHIIVALRYPGSWPTDSRHEEQYLKKKVVYAVAFWNAVHMRLKKTRHPRLRIRIDGIAIVRTDTHSSYHQLVTATSIQANRLMVNNNVRLDVPRVMITMTGSQRPEGKYRWNPEEISWTTGSRPYHLGIVYDDLLFGGLAGFSAANPSLIALLGQWSTADLNPEYYIRRGNPIINPPMPGQVLPVNKLCQALGWDADNQVSRNANWCSHLDCTNTHWYDTASLHDDTQAAVDGTYCYKNKVCMERDCVMKTDNTFAYVDVPLDHN